MPQQEYPEPKPAEPAKIAEPAAGYVISTPTTASLPAAKGRRIAGLEASNEVWEFAQKHQLVPHLETAIRLARESFLDIRKIYLTFESDPEIPTLDGIAINIKAEGTLDELVEKDRAFALRFIKELPYGSRSKISLFVGGA
jgi:hypothetical protein